MELTLLGKILGWLAILTPAALWIIKVVAEKAAEAVMKKHSAQLDAAVKQATENRTKLTELQTDIKWIREAIKEFREDAKRNVE